MPPLERAKHQFHHEPICQLNRIMTYISEDEIRGSSESTTEEYSSIVCKVNSRIRLIGTDLPRLLEKYVIAGILKSLIRSSSAIILQI